MYGGVRTVFAERRILNVSMGRAMEPARPLLSGARLGRSLASYASYFPPGPADRTWWHCGPSTGACREVQALLHYARSARFLPKAPPRRSLPLPGFGLRLDNWPMVLPPSREGIVIDTAWTVRYAPANDLVIFPPATQRA